jgi:hypothetical protein
VDAVSAGQSHSYGGLTAASVLMLREPFSHFFFFLKRLPLFCASTYFACCAFLKELLSPVLPPLWQKKWMLKTKGPEEESEEPPQKNLENTVYPCRFTYRLRLRQGVSS